MAVGAQSNLSSTIWSCPEKLKRNSLAVVASTSSSCRFDGSLSWKIGTEVRVAGALGIGSHGAELEWTSSMQRDIGCFRRGQGHRSRNVSGGTRSQGKEFGSGRGSMFRSAAVRNHHGIFTRDESFNPVRRRYTTVCRRRTQLFASLDDPYETLGVSPSASEKEIKQAYRRLALKFHPDVNKEANAQTKFLQIKAAYQTLVDSKSRAKYDASKRASPQWDPFSWETERPSSRKAKDEEFYGLGDFFKDVQISIEDFFRDIQADARNKEKPEAKPKSLWEELAEVGEEFVEFLEKELNISDTDDGDVSSKYRSDYERWGSKKRPSSREEKESNDPNLSDEQKDGKKKVESDIEEIEEMLAKIKKELGI